MAQRPVVITPDDDWEDQDWEDVSTPTTPQNTALETVAPEEEPSSFFRDIWNRVNAPMSDLPSRFGRAVGNYIDSPVDRDDGMLSHLAAQGKGFLHGALEGAGDVASSFTSPLNLATTILSGGSSTALKAGLPTVAKGMALGGRALGAPVIAHGLGDLFSPDSTLQERAMAIPELAGGAAAMSHVPTKGPSKTVGETPGKGWTSFWAPSAKEPQTPPAASKGASSPVQGAASEVAEGIVDKFADYRKVPVGTKYTVKPENMTRRKMADAIKLGFEYEGLDDNGRILIRKTKPSPDVNFPEPIAAEKNAWAEAANLPRTLMASMDMSAPLRQGIGLIHKAAFWKALPSMVKAWGSEEAYQAIQKSITDDPIFKKTVGANGTINPSFAEKAGLALTDLKNMTSREESIMSSLGDKIPGVRRSNRAYTAFLNKLRTDTFKQMAGDFGAYSGMDAKNNLGIAKGIADFVNSASGRGSLGKLEPSAKALSSILFSPRLIASRLQMMGKGGRAIFDPQVYMAQGPNIRREYLKSLMALAATAGTFTQLSRMAGATVETDPASSDMGKIKFGDTRIDPYAGYQQYIVAAQRLMPHIDLSSQGLIDIGGKMKSTTTEKEYSLDDAGFGRSDRSDILLRFIRSKTNPIINFGWGLLAGQKELSGKPMDMTAANPFENAIAQRFLPMVTQDIYDLIQSENTPLPAKGLAAFLSTMGMSSQTYGNDK